VRAEHWTARIGGQTVSAYLTLDDDGRPWAVHATVGKAGSDLGSYLGVVCAAATVCLRAGVPLSAVMRKWRGQRFEPCGETGDELAPECTSVVDYLARSIAARS
jgi:hypothetical protein